MLSALEGDPNSAMDDDGFEAARLLRLAQAGQCAQALDQAESLLVGQPSLGVLFARCVALHCLGDHQAAARAAEELLAFIADRSAAETAGWLSIALSFRASQQMLLAETDPESYDLESILHDLAAAEAGLSDEVSEGFVLSTAHTGIGRAYQDLRLYELARPHYQAAFDVAISPDLHVALDTAVTSQLDLAEMHLNWSVELHRIRDNAGGQEMSAIAAEHAARALEYARTGGTEVYAPDAELLAACADSDGEDHERVVDRIRVGLQAVEGRDKRAFALPFLAGALERAGQHAQALEVAEQACNGLPDNASWLLASAACHTHATLLARSESDAARAGLTYGDLLAKTMWRQRLRTLHNARSMQFLERVTLERDRVHLLAHTDALTGIGNRRAFDALVAELGQGRPELGAREATVILVDVDGLKAVNDAGGHEAGDRALQAVARALSGQVRPEDLVARIGGDEFVVVVIGLSAEDAGGLTTRMVDAVSLVLGSEVTVSVGASTGAASEVGSGVLRAADRAMYAAKRGGATTNIP